MFVRLSKKNTSQTHGTLGIWNQHLLPNEQKELLTIMHVNKSSLQMIRKTMEAGGEELQTSSRETSNFRKASKDFNRIHEILQDFDQLFGMSKRFVRLQTIFKN